MLTVLAAAPCGAAVNILSNTNHIVSNAYNTVTTLGVSGSVNVDYTAACTSSCPFLGAPIIIGQSTNTGQAQIQYPSLVSTGTPNGHVPYKVINQSSTGYTVAGWDWPNYSTLIGNDQIYVMAYCGGGGDVTTPTAFSTILPHGYKAKVGNGCGYAKGIEFSMTLGYFGLDTSSASSTTENLSGFMAAMRVNHSTWKWGDIKGALRQTGSNWSTGYNMNNAGALGFGDIDYTSATGIGSTASIFLQGPGLSIALINTNTAQITLYPFITTRRVNEQVYSVSSSYVWPLKNEYTTTDITASGATLLFSSNGTDVTPTFNYSPLTSGTITFVAFTLDGAGGFSRVENYSEQAFFFASPSGVCIQ